MGGGIGGGFFGEEEHGVAGGDLDWAGGLGGEGAGAGEDVDGAVQSEDAEGFAGMGVCGGADAVGPEADFAFKARGCAELLGAYDPGIRHKR